MRCRGGLVDISGRHPVRIDKDGSGLRTRGSVFVEHLTEHDVRVGAQRRGRDSFNVIEPSQLSEPIRKALHRFRLTHQHRHGPELAHPRPAHPIEHPEPHYAFEGSKDSEGDYEVCERTAHGDETKQVGHERGDR